MEIYKRYGPVLIRTELSKNEWTGDYKFKDYYISVTFSNNVSMSEIFSAYYSNSDMPRRFSNDERDEIFRLVAGGNWIGTKSIGVIPSQTWTNSIGTAVAIQSDVTISKTHDTISIRNIDFIAGDAKAEAKSKTDGL